MPISTRKKNKTKKIHKCIVCSREFDRYSKLKRHETVYSRKAYLCETCNRSFRCKDHYTSHVATCSAYVEDAENIAMCGMNVQDTDNADQMVPRMVDINIAYNFVDDMEKENESQTAIESQNETIIMNSTLDL